MRMILILAFLLVPAATLALDAAEMFEDPAQEARAREIGRQLRCLKCRNQSIFDSNAGIAKDLRVAVRERMVAGDTDEQILDYVHQRYGDYVLLNPKMSGQTLVLWVAPLALAALAGLGMAVYFGAQRRSAGSPELTEDDRAAAQALLRRNGG